jgi:uncharacterized membrane protein YeaQ/YmgE (transglycosylase-associated protein family)
MNNLMDLGGGVGWLGILVIGGLAGWIAEKLTKSEMGLFLNIVTGIIGAFIGRILANALGIQLGEIFQGRWFIGNLIVSVIGAVILIIVVKLVRNRAA